MPCTWELSTLLKEETVVSLVVRVHERVSE